MRYSGRIARLLRTYDIGLACKASGHANTDALTLTDLVVQELLVSAIGEQPVLGQRFSIQAEESVGEMRHFEPDAKLTIGIDPIDGTREYRDRTRNGYCIALHVRDAATVHYSQVFIPEATAHGSWLMVRDGGIHLGPDDPRQSACQVVDQLPAVPQNRRPRSKKIYVVGYRHDSARRAQQVSGAGLDGYDVERMPGSFFELFARGDFGGCLARTPNVYDFPISVHIARTLGGDAVWVHNRQPIDFAEIWLDDRSNMLRLPGTIACSDDLEILDRLCELDL
jgi:3'(2'), 5'-bisphosphate nucleotidase